MVVVLLDDVSTSVLVSGAAAAIPMPKPTMSAMVVKGDCFGDKLSDDAFVAGTDAFHDADFTLAFANDHHHCEQDDGCASHDCADQAKQSDCFDALEWFSGSLRLVSAEFVTSALSPSSDSIALETVPRLSSESTVTVAPVTLSADHSVAAKHSANKHAIVRNCAGVVDTQTTGRCLP